MYTLYYSPRACSLATQVILRELGQQVALINKSTIESFADINPVGSIPVLLDGEKTLTEGAAIILYLLHKHRSSMLPKEADDYQQAVQDIMFANATVHPAYSRLFFITQNMSAGVAQTDAMKAAAQHLTQLWLVVESRLSKQPFLGGDVPSAADILLAVYAHWGSFFPVEIIIGTRAQSMISYVESMESFQLAVAAEQSQTDELAS
ncbi:glutathione S-transferase family protein [Pseudoalteromonas sp. MMG022]|uniref:glutathione S-transferase family protein n=1 Tax=Pseudoalteromonas sp. MMG022 TaxID=2909978 RepID=UPI001F207EFE|nr:glutathione S-transferase family protein [Pseudoalteromonas sp. MMG022]MCF6437714.1 glutathione S-transferase family protein [Pseudoalteromonas sp. MMG022]